MCGRYTLYGIDRIPYRYEVTLDKIRIEPSYNIVPGQLLPVVTRKSPKKLELMKWGLLPVWAKDKPSSKPLINARAESITEKVSFKRAFYSRRCLVPANGFYEWKKTEEGKIPYYVHLKNQTLFSFAGIYESWENDKGDEVKSYAIITTRPNAIMANIHQRMPVILKRESEDLWLNPETSGDTLTSLLQPYQGEDLEAYVVSRLVNSPQNNSELLIQKEEEQVQSRLRL